jgi:hypothetical protein
LNAYAYSKGVSLGLIPPTPREVKEQRWKMGKEETMTIDLLHRAVPAKHTDEGLRALSGEDPVHPEDVEKYLEGKFGNALEDVSSAMLELAKSLPSSQLMEKAYTLYEKFRPEIPPGEKGGGPPASWTWTSSVRWLRPDVEEPLFNSPKIAKSVQLILRGTRTDSTPSSP